MVGTSPSPAWRWSRLEESNLGASGAKGFEAGRDAVLDVDRDEAVAELLHEAHGVLLAGQRPEQVQLDHDGRVDEVQEALVGGLPVERGHEFLGVVVIADGQAELLRPSRRRR